MSYDGLSASDWQDVDAGLAEAFAYTALPLIVQRVHKGASGDFDPLYGEAVGGTESWDDLPAINVWPRYFPHEELLQRLGLKVGAELFVFIANADILAWNKQHALVFDLTEDDQFVVEGKTYNVQKTRRDPLNVGDGRSTYTVGLYATGSTKPF